MLFVAFNIELIGNNDDDDDDDDEVYGLLDIVDVVDKFVDVIDGKSVVDIVDDDDVFAVGDTFKLLLLLVLLLFLF